MGLSAQHWGAGPSGRVEEGNQSSPKGQRGGGQGWGPLGGDPRGLFPRWLALVSWSHEPDAGFSPATVTGRSRAGLLPAWSPHRVQPHLLGAPRCLDAGRPVNWRTRPPWGHRADTDTENEEPSLYSHSGGGGQGPVAAQPQSPGQAVDAGGVDELLVDLPRRKPWSSCRSISASAGPETTQTCAAC